MEYNEGMAGRDIAERWNA